MKLLNKLKILTATDVTVITFYSFLILLNLIFHQRVEIWLLLVLADIIIITLVFIAAYYHKNTESKFWNYIHFWYPVILILFTFKQLYVMVHPIHPIDYDNLLIKIDRFIFGFDPTVALFSIAHPLLTEFLQIVYTSFYLLPIILGINLIINKKYLEFDYATFMIVHGFFLSYLGYFSLPAIGPRFTLHDFYLTNSELPGIFITNILREFVNTGESISSMMPNAAKLVQRDVFPSGHTQLTIVVMYLSVILKSKTKYFLVPTGLLLIFATVYLRYHYVIDLIGGLFFFFITIYSGKYLYTKWNKFINKPVSELI